MNASTGLVTLIPLVSIEHRLMETLVSQFVRIRIDRWRVVITEGSNSIENSPQSSPSKTLSSMKNNGDKRRIANESKRRCVHMLAVSNIPNVNQSPIFVYDSFHP
ncbi:hypothetical protein QLX08_002416 [Tetragonisca angustula]|uniref:Uncharacterized protein n=1 Tax=Tetragonisca angustula TaxID=166442 RepID=A0AAW1AD62_9HYME